MDHPTDGDLVRLLDGAGAPGDEAALAAHLAACASCAARREVLAARGARLTALLRAADPALPVLGFDPAPRAPRTVPGGTPRWFRLAAMIALVLAGATTVRPVRAWIADAARGVWMALRGTDPATSPATTLATVDTLGRVTFVPEGSLFRIQVAAYQATGRLVLEPTDGNASAALAGGAGPAEFVVLPDGLRILNAETASHDYVVRLPVTLRQITVVVQGGTARAVTLSAAPVVISLQR